MVTDSHIFLSYAREDLAGATRLCGDLRGQGRKVWFDHDCLRGGENWQNAIYAAIEESEFFIALLSASSLGKRGMVQREIRRALDVLEEMPEGQIYLVPVRLDRCRPTNARIKELHWIDLFPRWSDGVDRIIRATDAYMGEPDGSDTPTPFDDLVSDTSTEPPPFSTNDRVRASEAIRESIDLFRTYASSREIAIRFDDAAPNATIKASRHELVVAVSNLLSNAIKYSYALPGVGAWVSVATAKAGGAFELRVENWGAGIPKKDILSGNLFVKGYSGPGEKGSGFGLWVASTFAQSYSGEISIDSRPARSAIGRPQEDEAAHVTKVTMRLPLSP